MDDAQSEAVAAEASVDAEILAQAKILGDEDRGLSIAEIAELLNLQKGSVRSYLRIDKRRADLYRRLFVEDESIKERAVSLLEARRSS